MSKTNIFDTLSPLNPFADIVTFSLCVLTLFTELIVSFTILISDKEYVDWLRFEKVLYTKIRKGYYIFFSNLGWVKIGNKLNQRKDIPMICSPLEQFSIVTILPLRFGDLFLSFTNSSLYLLIATGLVSLLFYLVTVEGGRLVPSRWQSIVEMTYQFVGSLVEEQIGGEGRRYFPLILTTFLFLLSTNLVGMIPYSFTATSHLAVTFGLSLTLFIGITTVGFQRHGIHFFSFLLPKGAPLALAPLLVVLELVSYCFRAISLGVRLFANMMAGHTLVKIISSFAWTMLSLGGILGAASAIPVVIVFALTGLEIGVACLQAYVFTILICIYLNDAIHLH